VIKHENGQDTNITISVGVNSLVPGLNDSADNFISGADKALYAAKDAGRNKVIRFSDIFYHTFQN